MTILQSVLLGLVQGLTEFLPVSSSGHLVILRKLLGVSGETGLFYTTMLHIGTLAAIFAVFRQDIGRIILSYIRMIYALVYNLKQYLTGFGPGRERRYRKVVRSNYEKLSLLLLVSTVPTFLIGLLTEDLVRSVYSNVLAVGIGLYMTAVILLVVDYTGNGKKRPRDVSWKAACLIGICQGAAVFPGISRSGITIAACLLLGFKKKFSVKYSFLLAIPTVIGAAVREIGEMPVSSLTAADAGCAVCGFLAAGLSGYFCIRFMLRMVQKKKMRYFAAYCFLIGTVALVLHFAM